MENLSDKLDTELVASLKRGNEEEIKKKICKNQAEIENEIKQICDVHFEVCFKNKILWKLHKFLNQIQEFLGSCSEILNVQSELQTFKEKLRNQTSGIETDGENLLKLV